MVINTDKIDLILRLFCSLYYNQVIRGLGDRFDVILAGEFSPADSFASFDSLEVQSIVL